jgi:hypothetical protein
MKKEHVKLTETDRAFLEALLRKGELKARAYQRAATGQNHSIGVHWDRVRYWPPLSH